MKQEKKTIFFIITRGIIVRNLLRNKYFSELLNGKYKIVLILVKNYLEKPDEYFFNEFNDENIKIEIVKKESLGKLEKLLDLFAANLVITKSRKKYLRHNVRKEKRMNFFVYYFSIIFFWPLTKIVF